MQDDLLIITLIPLSFSITVVQPIFLMRTILCLSESLCKRALRSTLNSEEVKMLLRLVSFRSEMGLIEILSLLRGPVGFHVLTLLWQWGSLPRFASGSMAGMIGITLRNAVEGWLSLIS